MPNRSTIAASGDLARLAGYSVRRCGVARSPVGSGSAAGAARRAPWVDRNSRSSGRLRAARQGSAGVDQSSSIAVSIATFNAGSLHSTNRPVRTADRPASSMSADGVQHVSPSPAHIAGPLPESAADSGSPPRRQLERSRLVARSSFAVSGLAALASRVAGGDGASVAANQPGLGGAPRRGCLLGSQSAFSRQLGGQLRGEFG